VQPACAEASRGSALEQPRARARPARERARRRAGGLHPWWNLRVAVTMRTKAHPHPVNTEPRRRPGWSCSLYLVPLVDTLHVGTGREEFLPVRQLRVTPQRAHPAIPEKKVQTEVALGPSVVQIMLQGSAPDSGRHTLATFADVPSKVVS